MSELGKTLKHTRKEKGISLEELQASTKIQKRYLEAIEQGEYEQLPGRFYARAFIKSYAEAVGLDPDELFETYSGEVPTTNEKIPEQLPSRSQRTTARHTRKAGSPKGKSSSAVLPKLLAAIAVVGLFVVIWMAFLQAGPDSEAGSSSSQNNPNVEFSENPDADQKANGEKNQKASDKKGEKSADNESAGQNSDANGKKNQDQTKPEKPKQVLTKTGKDGSVFHYTLKNTNQFKLKIAVVNGNSWIEIRKSGPDGKKYFYGPTKPGDTITKNLTGNQQVFLKIGSTPHVEMYINGKAFNYPSDKVFQKFWITFQKSDNAS